MSEAVKIDGNWFELIGSYDLLASYATEDEGTEEARLTPSYVETMSEPMKEAFGIKTVVEPDIPTPAGKHIASYEIVDLAGNPKRVVTLEDDAPPAIPSITAYQNARENLERGSSVEAAQAFIDTTDDDELKVHYAKAAILNRDDPEIERLRGYIGWTSEQMDDFFIHASTWPAQK